MDKSEVQSIAFQLIGKAGEAYDHFYKAIECSKQQDFDGAEEEIKQGNEKLNAAHKSQTKLLTAEANEEDIAFSIILIHAQDHLMGTIMFERIAKEFIELYRERDGNKND